MTEPITPELRRQAEELIANVEARRFWRPLTNVEMGIVDGLKRKLAQANSSGPVFRREPESTKRRSRRPARKSRKS